MKFLKISAVCERTSLARSTIYKFMSNGMFPKQKKVGGKAVVWLESEIDDWMNCQISQSEV
jgi:prophage regulatory protein